MYCGYFGSETDFLKILYAANEHRLPGGATGSTSHVELNRNATNNQDRGMARECFQSSDLTMEDDESP